MSEFATDEGKLFTDGYLNANPPGQPQFALSAGGTGYASEIQRAGGSVVVDSFGGINLTVPGGAFLGIDSFNNITLNTSTTTGVITIETAGAGNDVNITNAGTISFDTVGAGALENVQTINGVVYPPPGGGGGTSITQGGALVACLGNGGINISSIGAGVTADIANAGTIAFDAAGARAITGLSTINGAAFVNGSAPYVLPADITVSTLTAATYVDAASYINVSSISGAGSVSITGSGGVTISSIGAGVTVDVTNAGTIAFDAVGPAAITGLSTINGAAFVNGSAPYVLPADITVSTLTAATSVDAPSYINVSSISGAGSVSITGSDIYLVDGIDTGLTVVGSVTSLNGVSSITGPNVSIASTAGDLTMSADSGLVSLTNGTGLQTSANIVPSFDTTFNLGISGQAWNDVYATNGYFSTLNGGITLTSNNITSATLEATSGIVLDGAATLTINGSTGAEGNVVAISGGYPAWVEPAVMPSGVITNADIIGATWDGVGTLGQYAYSFNIGVTLNSAAVVQVATWESDADEASTYWVVSSGLDSGLLRIVLAGNPVAVTNYNLSWVVLSNGGSPP